MKAMTKNLIAALRSINQQRYPTDNAENLMDQMPPQMQTSMSGTGGMAPPMEYKPSQQDQLYNDQLDRYDGQYD